MNNQKAVSVVDQYNLNEHDANQVIDNEKSQKLLQSIKIPPQPLTLIDLQKELAKSDPSCKVISDIICKDMSVAAGVIKTINSPFFGLRKKIDNIQRAVPLLGIPNVVNIANALSLRAAMCDDNYPEIDSYFDAANEVALVAAGIAKELGFLEPDQAYTLGLFHDCGIPALLQKFPNYSEVLDMAYNTNDISLTVYEDRNLNTNHAVVGYYICKSWNMSEDISLAILNHHNVHEVLMSGSLHEHETVKSMVALLSLSEYISFAYHGKAEQTNWGEEASIILDYLDLNEEEFDQLKNAMFEAMGD